MVLQKHTNGSMIKYQKIPRIIYIDPIWGNNTYPYYFGTIKEIDRLGNNIYFEKKHIKSVREIADGNLGHDDILIFGLGFLGSEFFWEIEGLKDIKNKKICYYHKPFNNQNEKDIFVRESRFDILLSTTPGIQDIKKRTGIDTLLFPYGCDDNVFGLKENPKKKYDIGFSGALHNVNHYKDVSFSSPNLRDRAQSKIKKYFGGKKYFNGSDSFWKRIFSQHRYARILASSRLWLSTTGPLHDMSSRYFEVGGSGAIPLTNNIPKDYQHIFRDGENIVTFNEDCSNILDRLSDTLDRDNELKDMSKNLRNEVLKSHTYKVRAIELIKIITDLLD